jgi:hypothetical protein
MPRDLEEHSDLDAENQYWCEGFNRCKKTS